MPFTRRNWMMGSLGLAAWAEIASAQEHAHRAVSAATPPRMEVLDSRVAGEIEAIAATILPAAEDGPGAREAGVIYFIDRALATFDSDKRDDYRKGMEQVQQERRKLFPDSPGIAALTPAQQIELVRAIEKTEFFELIRTHTIMGFYGDPGYGGNRGEVGWRQIGFESPRAYQPPFGYYDAETRK